MDLSFTCTFFKHDPRLGLNNNEIFVLRRELARLMERCGFGGVVNLEEERFANTEVTPVDDAYFNDTQELAICYRWSDRRPDEPPLDQRIVNIVSFDNGIPSLRRYLDANYPNIDFVARIIWS